jgi:hypothetical protein
MATGQWEVDLLETLGAPNTPANRQLLTTWQRFEGGHTNNSARYNWLNSTQGAGFPEINSVGVKAYPNYNTGIRMTAATILNGRYPDIVRALRSGDPYRNPPTAGLQVWVSGRPNGNPAYARKVLGGRTASANPPVAATGRTRPESGSGSDSGGLGGIAGALGSVWGSLGVPGGGLLPDVGGIGDFLKTAVWLLNPDNWLRMVEFLAGFLLLFVGSLRLMDMLLGSSPASEIAATVAPVRKAVERATPTGRLAKAVERGEVKVRKATRGVKRKRTSSNLGDDDERRVTRQARRKARSSQSDVIPF